ncbi:MAG: metallophosphoesterase [Methylotenera sp.]|nr:metallophosphoesterase [Oligoflexia bacterium]
MRFILILLTVLGVLYAYIGHQLVGVLSQSPAWKVAEWLLLGLTFALIAWLPLVRWNQEDEKEGHALKTQEFLEWGAHLSMGILSFLLLFCLLRDVVLYPVHRFHPFQFPLYGDQATVAILVLVFGSLAIGIIKALGPPRVKHVKVVFPNLHPGLEGFRIAQISDLHIGATIKKPFVAQVVAITNALQADLIAFTGDIIDGDLRVLREDLTPLFQLRSKLGTFYVTGNHEYYWGVEPLVQALADQGLVPLLNEHRRFDVAGATLVVAGVTDASAGHYDPVHASDPARALGEAQGDLKILLAHQPKSAERAEKAGFDLQLSGHTHGGQFVPWTWVVKWVHQFSGGLGRLGKMWIYVNLGTGYWGPPVRLGAPSEITLLELTRG